MSPAFLSICGCSLGEEGGTWNITRSAASSFFCSATMSLLSRPSFHAKPISTA